MKNNFDFNATIRQQPPRNVNPRNVVGVDGYWYWNKEGNKVFNQVTFLQSTGSTQVQSRRSNIFVLGSSEKIPQWVFLVTKHAEILDGSE